MSPGELAYTEHCSTCHGLIGEGMPATATEPMPLGPEIQHPVRPYAEWVVRNGREDTSVGFKHPMLSFGTADDPATDDCDPTFPDGCDVYVSDADLMLIFDYLDTPAQPTTGEGLYLDYCGNCHGADGLGGTTTRALTDAAVLAELVDTTRNGTHPGEEDNRPEHMPPMDQTILSDAELQLISDYIEQTFVQ
jgi:mono/diheme cytochrome c family protein